MSAFKQQLDDIAKLTDELKEKYVLIDVRPPVQFGIVNTNAAPVIADTLRAINVPQRDIDRPLEDQEKNEKLRQALEGKEHVFVMCRRGVASREVTERLVELAGQSIYSKLDKIVNVEGGLNEIVTELAPDLPLY